MGAILARNMWLVAILHLICRSVVGNALTSKCGGDLQGSNGAFKSPNYPKKYPLEVKCTWTITTPKDTSKIIITFPKFDVEFDSSCIYDYVEIKDQNKKTIGTKLCGKKTDLKVEVPGRIAYVVFSSDYEVNEVGFEGNFVAQKPSSKGGCDFDNGLCSDWSNDKSGDFLWTVGSGETPTLLTGPMTDRSGKGNYLFIESSPPRKQGDVARIVSNSLTKPRCMSLYYLMYGFSGMGSLRIFLKDSTGKKILVWNRSGDQGRTWKKAQFPLPVDGVSPFKVVIEGVRGSSEYSDVAIDDITFSNNICVEEGCIRQLSGPSGKFLTPNYPRKYPDDSRCSWTITGPVGTKKIIIKFHQFGLQVDTRCSKDYVKVLNKDDKEVGPNYCGFYPDGFGVKIHGNTAKVSFTSDHFVRNKGFNASFETILNESKDDCDFDTTACLWRNSRQDDFDWSIRAGRTPSFFTGPRGDYLGLGKYAYIESSNQLKGQRAHLVSGSMTGGKCMHFMFSLHGILMGEINILQEYQNSRKRLLSKTGNHERGWHKALVDIPDAGTQYKIVIEGVVGGGFTSDAAVDEISFTDGSCPSQPNVCGGYLTEASGVVQSPNFPGNYPVDAVCEWVINPLPYYKQLEIAFTKFDVEWSQGCSKDYVEIADGHGTRIGEKQCGSLKDLNRKTVVIRGPKGRVTLTSDSAKTGSGFHATYQVSHKRQACGEQLSGASGNFSSPNYPNNYTPEEICEWEITGARDKWLEISFTDFAIDDTVVCYYNYMLVYDGIHGDEIGRYCGMYAPAPIVIPSHVTNIRFATFQHGAARGFLANWRVVKPKM